MNTKKALPEYVRICLGATFLLGVIAHGMALVNKFCLADEAAYLFSVGSTTVSGRWFLGMIGGFVRWFFGSPNFSLPLTGGLLTILLTGLCSCVLVSWMGLKKKISWILISGLMITFPIMPCLFFYHFTAPYYMAGLLLIFLGGAILCRNRNIQAFVGGVVLVCLGLSIYQAFVSLFLSLLLIFFFREVTEQNEWTASKLLREILWFCVSCVAIALVYLLSVKISNLLNHTKLLDYKGISSMGSASISDYVGRIKLALYLYLFPNKSDRYAFLFPYRLADCYFWVIVCSALLISRTALRLRKTPLKLVTILLVLVFFPFASNFIYIACDASDIYTLVLFGQLAPFLLLVCLADWLLPSALYRSDWKKLIETVPVLLLSVFCLYSVRVDNAVYTEAQFAQTRSQAYFNGIVTQVKSTPGYTANSHVAFVGNPVSATNAVFRRIDGFAQISIFPLTYSDNPFCVSYHGWQEYISLWCGFNPIYEDGAKYAELPEVQAMPDYPDNGSIKMINDVVVVKLNDEF